MKRDFLKELGITEEETLGKILDENGKDIEKAKGDLEAVKAENATYKSQLAERDAQLEALKGSQGDVEALKKQIEQLQADNKAADEAHQHEVMELKINAAVEKALTASGSLNNTATKALLDLTDATLQDDGTVKDLEQKIEALKKDTSTSFLFKFKEKPSFKGARPNDGSDQADISAAKKDSEKTYQDFLNEMAL